jgi:DNA repair exonuclease SbcCD nuclease subunit|uniref:Calcineurin-like phosphoesterase domain-containing protein n=1 Tax=viral metagenome TaxID=1070528 RepID=A0A6C0H3H3_9ZZZZ
MPPVTTICIGDPHIQVANIPETDLLIERLIHLATERSPDLIIVLGDVLHTHERLHTIALNKAYQMIDKLRLIAKTYVLVGNHDMINNQVFLNDNHWLSGMKEWANTVIVDKVLTETIKGEKFVFLPYVPPGRFQEALNTLDCDWTDASCIFAHQEFAGCKMGAIISVEGDKWPVSHPNVVSGHIHSRQIPQENIYYTGSAMQHAFGESEKNIIAYLTFEDRKYIREEIDLQLPRKKIVYMDVEDVDTYEVPITEDTLKVTVSGNYDQFKALKKTKKYKNLLDKGVKVIFKPKKIKKNDENANKSEEKSNSSDFQTILGTIVNDQKDPYLFKAYELIVNGKDVSTDDVIFL